MPTEYERNYISTPQAGLVNRTAPLYTGAVVGGGTVVNGMFFHRGSAGDYDAWENLGNPGWGWKSLLPYFKKVCCVAFAAIMSVLMPDIAERDLYSAIKGDPRQLPWHHFNGSSASRNQWADRIKLLELSVSRRP